MLVEIDTLVGTVVVAHHKPSWPFPFEHEREQQAVLVARTLEDHIGSRDVHAVVLGDFDATPDSASMSFWRGRRPVDGFSVCYQDAWDYAHPGDPGYTFELTNPLVREGEVATAVTRKIDHILVRSICMDRRFRWRTANASLTIPSTACGPVTTSVSLPILCSRPTHRGSGADRHRFWSAHSNPALLAHLARDGAKRG